MTSKPKKTNRPKPAAPSPTHMQALDRFVRFWGEMASRWGINRTMAQIHALLYASEDPLDTDQIMEQLSISRGNANMNLRSLIDWKLVHKVQREGSRKDYYEAEKDVWHITAEIIKRREREELEPVMKELEACRDMLGADDGPDAEARFRERIENLMQLIEVFDGVTTSLLPFIQQKNAPIIRHLIEIADTLGAGERDKPGAVNE